jgi:hypothetical protein
MPVLEPEPGPLCPLSGKPLTAGMGAGLWRARIVHVWWWHWALRLETMEAQEQVQRSRERREVRREQSRALRRIAQSERPLQKARDVRHQEPPDPACSRVSPWRHSPGREAPPSVTVSL